MSVTAIRVENLGKQYRIGQGARYKNYKALRDTLTELAYAPFRKFSSILKRENHNGQEIRNNFIWALKDVSFEINHGEVVGFIGRNGAGKSTLLKILSRITAPTEGVVDLYGRVGSLLEVGTGFHPELTGRENVFLNGAILGMKRVEILSKFDQIVDFAEIEKFIDTPVKFYSSGMFVRLAFAVAAHLEPEILLVDEVLAVGDVEFQKKCLGKMGEVAEEGRTVLFVSHNMASIEHLCDKAFFLDQGRITYSGNVQGAISLYLGQIRTNEATFENAPLKRASARQVGDQIEILAEYELDRPLEIPSLGFVISDYMGNPVCGTNPVIDAVEDFGVPRKSGVVKVLLEDPKLLNGTYKLSLWFGNDREDYFHSLDCLSFEVVNMIANKQLPASSVGPVVPKCKWFFE